jgi:integrase
MERVRLTPDRIRRFVCPPEKEQYFLGDTEVPSLAVRATTAGARTFVFEKKLNRQTIRMSIGDVADWAIDSARVEARRLARLVDQDIDPRAEKAAKSAAQEAALERASRIEAPALNAWSVYVEARRPKWGAWSLRDHERMAKEGGKPVSRGRRAGQGNVTQPGALRPLLALPLSHLTDDRFQAWLRNEVARRPTQADLAYRLLSGFVNWCGERPEYRDQLPGGLNFARIARRELPKRTAKADCLQREQLRPWFEQVRQLANPVHRVYLQCLLLTGARREEMAALRWKDVDFRWNSLHIADKIEANGRPIPLTPYVAQLLRELKRSNVRPLKLPPGEKWEPSPWVFASSRAKSGRMQEPRIAHQRALTAAGLPPLTLHGLRRSFGTLAEWVECPVGIAAQIMGHKPSATAEKHYRQRPIDLLRLWHTRIEQWMLAEAGVEFVPEQSAQAPALGVVSA